MTAECWMAERIIGEVQVLGVLAPRLQVIVAPPNSPTRRERGVWVAPALPRTRLPRTIRPRAC